MFEVCGRHGRRAVVLIKAWETGNFSPKLAYLLIINEMESCLMLNEIECEEYDECGMLILMY